MDTVYYTYDIFLRTHGYAKGNLLHILSKKKYFKQLINGQLNFIKQIEGKKSKTYKKLNAKFEQVNIRKVSGTAFYLN